MVLKNIFQCEICFIATQFYKNVLYNLTDLIIFHLPEALDRVSVTHLQVRLLLTLTARGSTLDARI